MCKIMNNRMCYLLSSEQRCGKEDRVRGAKGLRKKNKAREREQGKNSVGVEGNYFFL